jgi:branched-chain amino acid transport system substrate-binding protein
LKIGVIFWLGWALGLDSVHGMELAASMINAQGGLDVGGEKYNIELVEYDSKFNPQDARAAAERLINQDKVDFILGDEMCDAWISETEAAHVLSVNASPATGIFNTNNKYTFQGTDFNTTAPSVWAWFAQNNPQVKTVVLAFPDGMLGHVVADMATKLSAIFGPKIIDTIFYPPSATDLSVVGTKVMADHPDSFCAAAGGAETDNLCYKAVYEAGFKGTIWSFVGNAPETGAAIVGAAPLEGEICNEAAINTPNPPPVAAAFKTAWIAKYGSWNFPALSESSVFYILITGITKAGSLDTDKVAATIANGMTFESLGGPSKMIARPDLGVSRTVDELVSATVIKTVGGHAQVLATINVDQAYQYCKTFYGWK